VTTLTTASAYGQVGSIVLGPNRTLDVISASGLFEVSAPPNASLPLVSAPGASRVLKLALSCP
jgi:hypothetical protein